MSYTKIILLSFVLSCSSYSAQANEMYPNKISLALEKNVLIAKFKKVQNKTIDGQKYNGNFEIIFNESAINQIKDDKSKNILLTLMEKYKALKKANLFSFHQKLKNQPDPLEEDLSKEKKKSLTYYSISLNFGEDDYEVNFSWNQGSQNGLLTIQEFDQHFEFDVKL